MGTLSGEAFQACYFQLQLTDSVLISSSRLGQINISRVRSRAQADRTPEVDNPDRNMWRGRFRACLGMSVNNDGALEPCQ